MSDRRQRIMVDWDGQPRIDLEIAPSLDRGRDPRTTHAYAFDIAFGVCEFCVCAIPTFRRLQRLLSWLIIVKTGRGQSCRPIETNRAITSSGVARHRRPPTLTHPFS